MFYLKITGIYAILYAVITFLILMTATKNPAIAFFLPSIIAMMIYARVCFQKPKTSVAKNALFCGLFFALAATGFSWLVHLKYNWIARPEIMFFICFAGNFIFPFMLFPKAKRAQSGS